MKTVLLIEDNKDIRENMSEILELSGYKVLTAADGKVGVATALESTPDIIVCDIMMPELDGYGVIHMLQKNKDTQNIPFIFLTAKSERAEIRKGMELGADDYITKPFNGTELLNAIESRLRKNELLRKEISPDLEGLNTLIHHAGGKDILQTLAEGEGSNTLKKKVTIYSEGNHALKLYYIKSGRVKGYKTNDDGKELITNIYNTGDFFGYIAILEQSPHKETTETLEESEIAIIPKNHFEDLIRNNSDVLKTFIGLLAKNISEKEEQLLGLAYNSLRKKIANALIISSGGMDNQKRAVIDVSRENLATIAGTAYESLIRTLKDFKEEKLIEIEKGTIVILDEKKLKHLIN